MSQRPRFRWLSWLGRLVLVLLALLIITSMLLWWIEARDWVGTDDAYVTGHLITLAAQSSGTVVEVLAENSHEVKAGKVLVRLDGALARFAWEEAKAHLGDTVRRVAARFADAADRLADIQRRAQAQSEEVASLREVCRLQDSLRQQGIADAAQVLEQRQALDLQTLRLRGLEADRYQAWVDLVEALGGGIDPPAPAGKQG